MRKTMIKSRGIDQVFLFSVDDDDVAVVVVVFVVAVVVVVVVVVRLYHALNLSNRTRTHVSFILFFFFTPNICYITAINQSRPCVLARICL